MNFLKISFFYVFLLITSAHAAEKIDEQVIKLVRSNNTFALQLFQNLNTEKGNLCLSPYIISSSLGMAYSGALGNTRQQMGEVLGFTQAGGTLNSSFLWINQFLTRHTSDMPLDFRIFLANGLWMQKGILVDPTFSTEMSTYYDSSFRWTDFIKHPDIARQEINDWVRHKTGGKITDILSSKDINNATRLLIVSAIFLKARWAKSFNAKATAPQPFFNSDNETTTALMMTDTGYYPFIEENSFRLVELPYIDPKETSPQLSMLIFLPKGDLDTTSVARLLTSDRVAALVANLSQEKLLLFIPKFHIDVKLNLNNVLTRMGMSLPFSDAADFSGMSEEKNLKIGQILHKGHIIVDEGGTEAAAATAINMETKAYRTDKEPILFKADRPFVFIVYEKRIGAILFIGRLENATFN